MTTHVYRFRNLLMATAAAVSMPFAAAAQARFAEPAADGITTGSTVAAPEADVPAAEAEIVVTARRREERAQDVPIALSVVSGEQIAQRGDYRLDQVQQTVPSLQVFSFNPRNTNINIRGLGSNVALTNDGIENGVGMYIDNVYYGRVGQSQFDLVDLDRIEVLRGPQGTLFGKNTTAGAINITSRLPSDTPEFRGEATIGDWGYHQVRGSVSGPIGDGVGARLSIADTHRDGFIYNYTTRRWVHDYDNFTARGQVYAEFAPGLTVRLIGDYSKQTQECCINLPVTAFASYDNGAPIANNFIQRFARLGYTPLPLDPFARRTDANSRFQANMNTWGVSGEVNWDLGPVTLASITASRKWNWYPGNDSDYTARSVQLQSQQQNFQRQFSQELRLGSNGSNAIDWVIGGYYFWQKVLGKGTSEWGSDAALALYPTDAFAVASAATDGFLSRSQSDPHTRSLAAFGQGTWHITPALDLTAGLRFTHEDKWGSYRSAQVAGPSFAGLTAAQAARAQAIRNALAPQQSYSVEAKDDSFSWLLTLGWKPADDVLTYATWSRGTKSQGLNLTNVPAGVDPAIDPESVDNYEIGLKSQWLNRTVTFNLAAYWTDVTDYQTTIVQQVIGTNNYINYIANIPSVRSRGFEGDVAWQANDYASFTGALSYTDATYRDYAGGPAPVEELPNGQLKDLTGATLAGVPKWSASLGTDLQAPVNDRLQAYAHADWSYRSEYYTAASNSRYALVPGYGIVNARLGVKVDDGRLDLSVWARNLFDKNYFQTLSVVNYGLVTAILGDPRTIGVTLRTRI